MCPFPSTHYPPHPAPPRPASPRLAPPRHATPRHATPRHATPRHALDAVQHRREVDIQSGLPLGGVGRVEEGTPLADAGVQNHGLWQWSALHEPCSVCWGMIQCSGNKTCLLCCVALLCVVLCCVACGLASFGQECRKEDAAWWAPGGSFHRNTHAGTLAAHAHTHTCTEPNSATCCANAAFCAAASVTSSRAARMAMPVAALLRLVRSRACAVRR